MVLQRPACWRDWTGLPAGPAGLIAERLLANDVADYVRFRAASSAWRASSDDPRAKSVLDRRYHPRRWIIPRHSFGAHGRRRRLLNVATGECINLTQPDSRRYCLLGPTAEGLLVLCRRGTLAMQLLNPLTGQVTELPPADTLINHQGAQVEDLQVLSAGMADDSSMVALVIREPNMWFPYNSYSSYLAVARPAGDKSWTRLSTNDRIVSASQFAGRFYCATPEKVFVLQAAEGQQPRLVRVADYGFRAAADSSLRLVDNNGELIVTLWSRHTNACKVYQADLDAGKMVSITPRVEDDKRAVFISSDGGHAMSVHAGWSPSISGDAVYFCKRQVANPGLNFDVGDMLEGIVMRDRRTNDACSIIDHLARYVPGYW